jgi:glucose-6-phosphate 1-dehydrogenase
MIQNHLTQLFTLVAMEAPSSFDADAIRQEKIKVLRSLQPIHKDDLLFGQYTAGMVQGEAVPGYREEDETVQHSNTETFAAIRLNLSNWRWQGVPFILRTGKRLPERRTQISVTFRRAPVSIFQPHVNVNDLNANTLLIKLQPNEGFDLNFEVKTPREPFELATQQLKFRYEDVFGKMPDGYETLLLDTVTGDQTLFVHADEVEASWRLYDPILENGFEPVLYEAGSRGPEF